MSDSDENLLVVDLKKGDQPSSLIKKPKMKRSNETFVLNPTEDEIKYRAKFHESDVTQEFPELLKCTKCMYSFKSAVLEGREILSHPLLKVLMCDSCCLFYGNGEFSLDEDGEDKYCRWCGEGGKIFLCAGCICGFCPQCIKKNFGKSKVREIERDDEWLCFFCNPKPLWKLRAVCSLAKKQANRNRAKLPAEERRTRRKGHLPKLRHCMEANRNPETSSQDENTTTKGDSDNDDSPSSSRGFQDSQGSYRRLQSLKRKWYPPSNSKGKASTTSTQEQSDDTEEPPKKLRSRSSRNSDKLKMNLNRNKSKKVNETGFSSTSSSDSSDDEDENQTPAKLIDLNKKENPRRERDLRKKLRKLKNIFQVTETISELCLKTCRKNVRKMDKNLFPEEKLLRACEKLRSMIVLMSCSFSTLYDMIISLQKTCEVQDNLDIKPRGIQESTLLEAMTKFLRNRRMKSSCFFNIVSDILNRYPFIELGVKNFNNYISKNVMRECVRENFENGTLANLRINSALEQDNADEGDGNPEEAYSSDKTMMPKDLNLERSSAEDDTKNLASGAKVSSQALEFSNNQVSNNHVPSEQPFSVTQSNLPSTSSQDNPSSTSLDMDEMYSESLKIKEMLLLSSSDDSFTDEEEEELKMGDKMFGNSTSVEAQTSPPSTSQSNEEREIMRLIDLSSLERSRRRSNLRRYPVERHVVDRNLEEPRNENNNSNPTAENTVPPRIDEEFRPLNPRFNNMNYNIRQNLEGARSFKDIFLGSLSSTTNSDESCSSDEDPEKVEDSSRSSSSDEDPEKVEGSSSSSSKVKAVNRQGKKKSSWRSDKLLRASLSFFNSKGKNEALKPNDNKAKASNEEAKESDSSLSSLNISPITRKNRKKVFSSTSADSDAEPEPLPVLEDESPSKGRKNIQRIVKTGNLQVETRQAVKMENERKKRVAERRAIYEKLFPNMLESDRLILDFDPETNDVLLEVPTELAKKLKPHQKEGVKFMWDCCFESLDSLEHSNGSGCVLAHCMGLGKTLQIITLIFTVMKNDIGIKTILILCPLNVVSNWVNEFKIWLKDIDFNINVFNLNNMKRCDLRHTYLREWQENGGVMIVSYDLLRNLTSMKRSRTGTEKISDFSELLLHPGPDLVICDEGHLLKNQGTALFKSITKINTSRRIILTGTPLQNNLTEYHSMVQFIKPNILGTRREFMNRFGNPILNGQFEDSTAKDVKLMRARSHVLHKLLDGCIQRFNYSVLTPYLPEKHEYVLSIRLTTSQAKLYQYFVDRCKKSLPSNKAAKLFSDFHLLQKIWTHPKLLAAYTEERDDLNSDLEENRLVSSPSDDSVICLDSDVTSSSSSGLSMNKLINPEEYEKIESSGKLVLLLHILSGCRKVGDKVLVFSQSLTNLDLIEHFLRKIHLANESGVEDIPAQYRDTWEKGIDYYRMEGSTSYEARTNWCKSFNNKNNKRSRLFLISTKAGGLGINLIGANRVIIFDVSWNPSQDVQSIFRVYRFGQVKTCYVYRFVAEGTMEEKIYARQVTKLSLEKRVLDEQQIERHYTMGNLQELYTFDPIPKEKWKVPLIPKDMILAKIINNKNLIASYHEHDSLLENKEEEKLTDEERKAAWDDFEKERFMAEHQLSRSSTNNSSAPGASSLTPEISQIFNARMNREQINSPVEPLRDIYNHTSNHSQDVQMEYSSKMPATGYSQRPKF